MINFRTLIIAAAMSFSCIASATVIDFEDLAGQGAITSNYAGLTWGASWDHYDWSQAPYNANSGTQRAYNNSGANTDWFKFASDVVFNGAYFAGNYNAQFELYNNNALVFSSAVLNLSSTPTFLSSGYAGLIDEVRLNVSNGQFVIDDITYNAVQSHVAEPTPLVLLFLGLGALAIRRRA